MRGGRSASPAMQIKYSQRWAASFLDWFNWVSQLKVTPTLRVVRAEPALSFTFVALSRLSEGGPYHQPLRRCQRKEDSSCGNCGKTGVGGTGNSRGSGNY